MEKKIEFMSVKDIARLLQVNQETVYRWIKKGQIPYVRVGGRYKFLREDVLNFFLRGGGKNEAGQ